MSFTRLIRPSVFVAAIAALPVLVHAQAAPAAQTATQFYTAYRAAFDKATKIEDLFPYMTAANVKQAQSAPADQRTQYFGMMKMVTAAVKDVKVTKETPASGGGATLTAQGTDVDSNKTMHGTIKIVREGGALKLGDESWSDH